MAVAADFHAAEAADVAVAAVEDDVKGGEDHENDENKFYC